MISFQTLISPGEIGRVIEAGDAIMRDGESCLREDTVEAPTCIASQMTITSQRVVLGPPRDIAWFRWRGIGIRPRPDYFEIDLRTITRLWKWTPEFAMPPMVAVGNDGVYIRLLERWWPLTRYAPKDRVREHFEALEAAWNVALERSRLDRT